MMQVSKLKQSQSSHTEGQGEVTMGAVVEWIQIQYTEKCLWHRHEAISCNRSMNDASYHYNPHDRNVHVGQILDS